ncbi:MAG: RecX family transcriptional regulator [Ignavibacteriae bacterium]|nr:RecX family transcriptional regulator [Ignavibacteriota bacterium]
MILSKIERLRNNRCYNLYVDGEPLLRVHEEVLVKFGLRTGDELEQETLETLKTSEEFVVAKEKALGMLSRRVRSEKELRDSLRNKEFHPHTINMVVTHLNEMGILDDKNFARLYTNHILSRKPSGKALLQRELRIKGISSSLIKEVLQETLQERNEEELACNAAMKVMKRLRGSSAMKDTKKRQQKIVAHLSSRGFSFSTIQSALRKISSNNSSFTQQELE